MTKEPKKTKKTVKKDVSLKPLDIGLPKSGLVSGKKSMDIVPHSKTMPSSSAKPVIVSHRTVVKDPMAPPELTDVPAEEKTPKKLKKSTKIVIEPLHNDVQPEKKPDVSEAEKSVESAPETKEVDPLLTLPDTNNDPRDTLDENTDHETELSGRIENEDVEKQKTEEAEKSEDEGTEDNDALDEEAEDIKKSTEPKPEELEQKRAEKRAEEAAKLIESKKYFLPINAVKKRRSMRLAWFVLAILITGVVVAGLLDAEILTFMTAPTDFI